MMSTSVCVCLFVREHISGTTRHLYQFFCACCYGRGSVLLRQGDEIPKGMDNFWVGGCPGHSKALAIFAAAVDPAFTAKGIIQSPITSCSRRGHSVRQTIANRNPDNSERRRRRCGLSAPALRIFQIPICTCLAY